MPGVWPFQGDAVQLTQKVQRHGSLPFKRIESASGREPPAQTAVRGTDAGPPARQNHHRKKVVTPAQKKQLTESCIQEEAVTVSSAYRVVGLHKSLWYYRSRKDDTQIIEKLRALAERFPTRGFDDYYGKIRNEGLKWNRKRVLRVYRSLKLGLRRKHKRRLPVRIRQPLQQAQQPNERYSMDFLSDALATKRKVRVLNIMDDCTRESLAVYADFSIPGEKVVDVLVAIVQQRGKPQQIRVDNGPAFLSKTFVQWCSKQHTVINYIQPGKPMQNGYVERLNRTFREDVLDAYEFDDLEQLRMLCDEWQYQYNNFHPHQALNGKTPAMTVKNYQKQNQGSLN